ncbi:amidohydrolase family protein [Thiomicrorhabdus sp. ZW0627]|uniref:amidohydrolase family protein n=1 Tax=Thiomicrorhabdus sp. ZW0627 TaxID=3039774 RepID=UPI0024367AC2|nr:amidohydrolase family protein [Thiomicrorhabdus sp. ZW0627]MDG6773416.1 amidohydrolase family protein [Thiomicrorhabdus sp. ZW0627]
MSKVMNLLKWTGLLVLLGLSLNVRAEMPIFDSHLHYGGEDVKAYAPKEIMAIFDRSQVTHALISSTPNDGTEALYHYAPKRIIPFLGVYETLKDKRDWMYDETVVAKAEEALKKGFYRGLGEFHIFAKDKKSPVFKGLVKLAEKHGLMLQAHGDAEIIDEIFAIAPKVTVLWAHMGTRPEPDFLRSVLQRHPDRLYIDTSVRDTLLLGTDGYSKHRGLTDEWKKLFIDYQDRFLVAVDTFSVNRWNTFDSVVKDIRSWLSQLPEPVARKLAYENARKLFLEE